jgi:hypothetical protein
MQARFARGDTSLTMEEVMQAVDSADPSLGIIRKGVH